MGSPRREPDRPSASETSRRLNVLSSDGRPDAVKVTLAGAEVPVMSAEDLVGTKVLAGRPKDLEDIQGVLRERLEVLDLQIIRSTLASLEEALGQSDLRPLFERELASAKRRRGSR